MCMKSSITLILDAIFEEGEGVIFCGFINGSEWAKSPKWLSRSHKQPNRISSSLGVHPSICSSETQGRYYVCEIIYDSSNEREESR